MHQYNGSIPVLYIFALFTLFMNIFHLNSVTWIKINKTSKAITH